MQRRLQMLIEEFAYHLPYTIASSLIAMAVVWVGRQMPGQMERVSAQGEWPFHVLHLMHLCLSAVATTSVFWRHERRLLKTFVVGFLGTIIPCGLSDYIFPFVGGRILGQPMQLHVCMLEHPTLVLPFVLLGVLAGLLFERHRAGSSLFSHGAHVFVSSVASLLYLVSFGFTQWLSEIQFVFPVFLIVVIAVWIPCCISDIVIPVGAVHHEKGEGSRVQGWKKN